MTALAAPASPRVGTHESRYATAALADGWMQFDVTGAKGPTAPTWLLLIGPLLGAGFGSNVDQTGTGLAVGLFLSLCYWIGRTLSLGTFRRLRAPAGRFAASPRGLRLPNGAVYPAAAIRAIVVRNVMDGHVLTSIGGGPGYMGQVAAVGAAKHAADANAYLPIAYQLELEYQGRSVPIVGCLTAATANALFADVSRVLDLH